MSPFIYFSIDGPSMHAHAAEAEAALQNQSKAKTSLEYHERNIGIAEDDKAMAEGFIDREFRDADGNLNITNQPRYDMFARQIRLAEEKIARHQAELEDARSGVTEAQAALEAAEAQLDASVKGSVENIFSLIGGKEELGPHADEIISTVRDNLHARFRSIVEVSSERYNNPRQMPEIHTVAVTELQGQLDRISHLTPAAFDAMVDTDESWVIGYFSDGGELSADDPDAIAREITRISLGRVRLSKYGIEQTEPVNQPQESTETQTPRGGRGTPDVWDVGGNLDRAREGIRTRNETLDRVLRGDFD